MCCDSNEINPVFYPVNKKTLSQKIFRNFYCPCYEQCLDEACNRDMFLCCDECINKDAKDENLDLAC